MIKKYYSILLILLLTLPLLAQPLKVVKQTSNKLIVEYIADVNELIKLNKKDNISFYELTKKMQTNQIVQLDSNLALPIITELIAMPVEDVNVEIISSKLKSIPLKAFDKNSREIINLISKNKIFRDKVNNTSINVKPLGYNGELKIGSLSFCPFRISNNYLEIFRELTIAVNFNYANKKLTQIRNDKIKLPIINPEHAKVDKSEISRMKDNSFQSKNSLPNYYGNAFRIYTKEEGIYKITYSDLISAEISPENIQISSVKMLNKGFQVPFLIIGEEDGSFDEDDYIEFWADEIINNQNNESSTNLYRHPFTAENVYIFVWGEGNGVRLIEESAAIQEDEPQNYNRSLYFKDKIHWEQDNVHLKMGYFRIGEFSYKYDNWFVDAGISAIGRKSYNVELAYPDSFSFEPIKVEVMLHGQANGATHKVMAWINNNI